MKDLPFTSSTGPLPVAIKQFFIATITEEIVRPGHFENNKERLQAFCEEEKINFHVLESEMRLFFGMVSDYNISRDSLFYRFLMLQASYCFLTEADFAALPIPLPLDVSAFEMYAGVSTYDSGMVGAHLIGL